jgi:hypothetical protein
VLKTQKPKAHKAQALHRVQQHPMGFKNLLEHAGTRIVKLRDMEYFRVCFASLVYIPSDLPQPNTGEGDDALIREFGVFHTRLVAGF